MFGDMSHIFASSVPTVLGGFPLHPLLPSFLLSNLCPLSWPCSRLHPLQEYYQAILPVLGLMEETKVDSCGLKQNGELI